jgi:hypothetical protein
MKNWSKAEDMASAIINSGQFALLGDLNKVFKFDSKETIFQLVPVLERINSGDGFIFVPLGKPNYLFIKDFLNAFENGDLRKVKWVNSVTIGGTPYSYPFKYKIFTSSGAPTEYNIVLRLAEQYLIRAEARAQQNRIEEAVTDLDTIRVRAGLSVLSATISYDVCLQKIEQERRMELFAEWGHRWFDLKRTNRANAVLGVTKAGNWNANDQLYPIPSSELVNAPNLVQNPGYD